MDAHKMLLQSLRTHVDMIERHIERGELVDAVVSMAGAQRDLATLATVLAVKLDAKAKTEGQK